MTENNEKSSKSNEQNDEVDDTLKVDSIDERIQIKADLIRKTQEICEKMMNNQEGQKKLVEELLEKQNALEKVLNSMRGGKVANDELADPIMQPTVAIPMETEVMKPLNQFIIKTVFDDMLKIEKGSTVEDAGEDHFGVPWYLSIYRHFADDEHAEIIFTCGLDEDDDTSIEAEVELKIVHPIESAVTRKYHKFIDHATINCFSDNFDSFVDWKFIKWEEMMNKYVVDGSLTVEAHVNILSKTGDFRKNFRCFDVARECSDIVLIVNFERFFVSKKFLAGISPFFYSLFFGQFAESRKSEIVLNGILPADFHNFLQVVYHEPAIDEFTVEGILLVADLYDTAVIRRKCDEFLVKESKKSLKKKFQLAYRYNLEKLKEKCLSKIKTMDDIRSIVPEEISDLDKSATTLLLEKCIAFQ